MPSIAKLVLTALVCAAIPAAAHATVDPNAPVILVRKDCGTLDDCFETLASALSWTWGTRNPTASSPLLMDVGVGTWNETWSCPNGRGYVTVRGAGREATKIKGTDEGGSAFSCQALEFMDLTFEGDAWGFRWLGSGSSVWSDVDIVGTDAGIFSLGWADDVCIEGVANAVHYFFGSRIRSFGAQTVAYPAGGFWGECSETWFYGGEILWEVEEGSSANGAAVFLGGNTEFHAFGTAIRATHKGTTFTGGFITGLKVSDVVLGPFPNSPSVFHMHGGIVSVNASAASGVGAFGVWAENGVTVHTPATAWALNSAAGKVRIFRSGTGGTIDVPFLWQTGTKPPQAAAESNELTSEDGQDVFVETDCAANGDCNGAGSQTHLMVYNPTECGTGEPWFDTVTGRCRNDTGP